jgi:hypothetical protein
MPEALTKEQIDMIMGGKKPKKEVAPIKRFPAPPQFGPLIYVEKEARCVVAGYYTYETDEEGKYTGKKEWIKSTTGGCHSSTNYRVNGKPMCVTHALRELNELLIDRDFGGQPVDETGECDHNACNWSPDKVAPEFKHLLKDAPTEAVSTQEVPLPTRTKPLPL